MKNAAILTNFFPLLFIGQVIAQLPWALTISHQRHHLLFQKEKEAFMSPEEHPQFLKHQILKVSMVVLKSIVQK